MESEGSKVPVVEVKVRGQLGNRGEWEEGHARSWLAQVGAVA